MDELIYNAITNYYGVLSKLGYYKYKDVYSLLVLCFIRDFIYNDYRGILSSADYKEIEKALNCLYGTSCLIPYPDYLKMGKLHIGEITELSQRVTALEESEVLQSVTGTSSDDSDITVVEESEE